MLKKYHRAITIQALSDHFSPQALENIISANLAQDHWFYGQIGHPEYHFDDNAFQKGWSYLERNRAVILPALEAGEPLRAQQAFGRLAHAAQDFYAHSNYVSRWLSRFTEGKLQSPDDLDALDDTLLQGPDLRSGKVYWPFEPFAWIPGLTRLLFPFLPSDSHTRMNLDSPDRGPGFVYAFSAAVKRTLYEYELTAASLPPRLLADFSMDQNSLLESP